MAMIIFFACRTYYTCRFNSVEWVFYGIAINTAAAAMAFEMAHNLIFEWARNKAGRNAKTSYCLGIDTGLLDIAQKEKREEGKRLDERGKRGEGMQQQPQTRHLGEDFHRRITAMRPSPKTSVLPSLGNDGGTAVKLEGDQGSCVHAARERSMIDDDIEDQVIFKHEENQSNLRGKIGEGQASASSEDQESVSDDDESEAEHEAGVISTEEEEAPLDLDVDSGERLRKMAPATATSLNDLDSHKRALLAVAMHSLP